MFSNIRRDLSYKQTRMYGSVGLKNCLRVLVSDGTIAMLMLRCSQWLYRFPILSVFGYFISAINMMLNGVVVGKGARIGPGMVIMHSVGIVVNGKCVVGENSVFQSGVVLGSIDRRSPVIGDNVFFGAGCKVLGNIRVGDQVNIGANAVVVKDVLSNVTVVGVPGVVLRRSD